MKFTAKYDDKFFTCDTADELYIFGLGIELGVETLLNIDIDAFVKFVNDCHEQDCFNAPLKAFTAFIVTWWTELRDRDEQFIVNKFYEIQDY